MKAAIDTNVLVTMVLASIVMLVLLVLYRSMAEDGMGIARTIECKESVRLGSIKLKHTGSASSNLIQQGDALVSSLVNPFNNPVRLDCSTNYLKVGSNDPEEIKKTIADEMVGCWNQYGEGNIELFDTKDNNYCVVCSRIEFERDVEINRFVPFLISNKVPFEKFDISEDKMGQRSTYYDYLMAVDYSHKIASSYPNSKLESHDSFTTNYPLAVMFVMAKDAYPGIQGIEANKPVMAVASGSGGLLIGSGIGLALCVTTAGIGCGIIAIIGGAGGLLSGAAGYMVGSDRNADWDARIVLWDYNNLKDLDCTFLEAKSTPLTVVQK
ncbi:MAG: hypothetical protein ABIG95_05850 [Candidatus Woesearchaeota archaeon]